MDGEGLLRMKPHEIKRLHLIGQALEQKISQKQAAEVAGLSPRQMRRLSASAHVVRRAAQSKAADHSRCNRADREANYRRTGNTTEPRGVAVSHEADVGDEA